MLARGNENFCARGENRTRDLPNSRSDVEVYVSECVLLTSH